MGNENMNDEGDDGESTRNEAMQGEATIDCKSLYGNVRRSSPLNLLLNPFCADVGGYGLLPLESSSSGTYYTSISSYSHVQYGW